MYTPEQNEIMHLSDGYTVMYAIISRAVMDALGDDGEAAVREATRRYGRDRGRARRNKHLELGVKINMRSLFSVCSDLPPDPRFRRDRALLTDEERNSRTLICPMADVWKRRGMKKIGRIYCEEFHPACYGEYAWGMTRVNLARTLTQDGDAYCDFHVVLRKANVPDERKARCFAEFDPGYSEPCVDGKPSEGKAGFSSLCVRVYYYMLEVLRERFPDRAEKVMTRALRDWADDAIGTLGGYAAGLGEKLGADFAERHFPMFMNADDEPLWEKNGWYGARRLLEREFYPRLLARLNG